MIRKAGAATRLWIRSEHRPAQLMTSRVSRDLPPAVTRYPWPVCSMAVTSVSSMSSMPLSMAFSAAAAPSAPIFPVHPSTQEEIGALRERLLARKVYPSFIEYPGGPEGGYFRFAISSEHSDEQLDN